VWTFAVITTVGAVTFADAASKGGFLWRCARRTFVHNVMAKGDVPSASVSVSGRGRGQDTESMDGEEGEGEDEGGEVQVQLAQALARIQELDFANASLALELSTMRAVGV
jgi:hypothetical protein